MADLKLKRKPVDGFEAHDPLAELTRIMGIAPQSAPDDDDLDGFGVDLERELLGEFVNARPDAGSSDAGSAHEAPEAKPDETGSEEFELLDDHTFEEELAAQLIDDQDGEAAGEEASTVADPLGRLEEFSRDWFARRQSAASQASAGAVASAVEEVQAMAPDPEDDDPVPHNAVGYHADTAYNDESGSDDLDLGDFDLSDEGEAPARSAEVGAIRPVATAANEPAQTSEDHVFDPFAELAAMAEHSKNRASKYAPQAPAEEPASPAEADPEDAVKDEVIAARLTEEHPQEYAEPAHEPPATVFDADPGEAAIDEDLGNSEVYEEKLDHEPEAAPRDTWAAISAWAGQPEAVAESDTTGDAEAEGKAEEAREAAAETAAPDEFEEAAAPDVFEEAYEPRFSLAEAESTDATPEAAMPAAWTEARDDDALDLGSMLESELPVDGAMAASEPVGEDTQNYPGLRQRALAASPEVDTIEVPEAGIEISDDLDIPDLVFEDDLPRPAEPDELDLEFASAYEELAEPASRQRSAAAHARSPETSYYPLGAGRFAPAHGPEMAHSAASTAIDDPFEEAARAWEGSDPVDDITPVDQPAAEAWPDDAYRDAAPGDETLASAFYHDEPVERPRGRRGLAVAAIVAGVAILGGVGAFALSWGDGDGSAPPALVKADASPVKVKPETPGGVTVPNEDKAVYDRIAGGTQEPPAQEKLVSTREEPVDIAAKTPKVPAAKAPADEGQDNIERAKSEDRIEQEIEAAASSPIDGVPSVAPRRVRTMVVKPDGTLVPREEPAVVATAQEVPEVPATTFEPADDAAPAPAVSEAAPAAPVETPRRVEAAAPVEPAAAGTPGQDGAPVAAGTPAQNDAPVVAETPANGDASPAAAETPETAQPVVAAAAETPANQDTPPVRVVETKSFKRQSQPDRGPVAPSRPSDQPVDIVGNTGTIGNRQTQVAALQPAPAAPVVGDWSMQISSQPSPEGAQKSYVDMARRYGDILGGRGVNIVKADIAGKGTFWRVRIPAGTRSDAVDLCERYKAAGGSCFVAK